MHYAATNAILTFSQKNKKNLRPGGQYYIIHKYIKGAFRGSITAYKANAVLWWGLPSNHPKNLLFTTLVFIEGISY